MIGNLADISSIVAVIIYTYVYFKKSFKVDLSYFLAFLFFMFIAEMTSLYLHSLDKNTTLVYHLLIFFEFNFLFLFIRSIIKSVQEKRKIVIIIYVFNFVYLISSIYYYLQNLYFLSYNSLSAIIGGVLITISLFYYFKDFLNSDEILNYKKTVTFWISIGLLIYYLGSVPITSILNNFGNNTSVEVEDYLYNLQYILVLLMYSSFIFGALWSQKQVK